MVRGFLLLAFLAGSAASAGNDAARRVTAIEARIGGRIGVTALDTRNSKRFDYRARRSDFRRAARLNFSPQPQC